MKKIWKNPPDKSQKLQCRDGITIESKAKQKRYMYDLMLSILQLTAMTVPMMALQLILLTQRFESVGGVDSSDYQHLYTDSFPRNDEYDMMALEPETPYGTPYGGFSRATASRLAALPLNLPSISKEMQGSIDDTGVEPMYTTVRDNFGRQYACRSYHEDELEPDSLGDSMFDTPRLKKKSNTQNNNPSPSNEHETEQRKDGAEENIRVDPSGNGGSTKDSDASAKPRVDSNADTAAAAAAASSSLPKLSELGFDPIMLGHTIHKRLTKLTGLCAQLHPSSWWSYEWCHQHTVKQFHVKISKSGNGKIKKFELEDITNLGSYSGRRIEVAMETKGDDAGSDKGHTIDLAQGRKEIGRVVDTFVGGDNCPDTGNPRVTEATFRCCSDRYIARNKGGVLKNGNQVDTDIVSVFQATEADDLVCHYNITLCTPLLCDDYDDGEGTGGSASKSKDKKSDQSSALDKLIENSVDSSFNKNKHLNLELDPAEAEKMSVVEILERTFGKSGNFCIRSQTGGWWSYEFCPGDYVRQYHEEEVSLMDQVIGIQRRGTTPGVTEHYLGRFIPEDHKGVTKENEWERIVNATTTLGGSKSKPPPFKKLGNNDKKNIKSQSGPSTSAGGNGAYYFQEYTKGDVCDHEDVTDSAVKAGEFGEGGIERAITVRYSCNSDLTISVKEDSSCHYIVDITVPSLCHHPLFRAPISKRQVVKCLPVIQ
jgi:hypothetical protein